MRHCELCHRSFLPVVGMNPVYLTLGEEEQFLVHQHCCEEVLGNSKKLKGEEHAEYVRSILNQLSN